MVNNNEGYSFGTVLLTPKCSNNCVFCRVNSDERANFPEDLTREMEVNLLRDTLDLLKRGIKNIDISGTEPLRYSKIVEYIKWIRPKFKTITILDPGVRLKDFDFAKKLVEVGPDRIILPIYGSKARYHDTVVDRDGAFEELIQGIRNLLKLKDIGYKFNLELTTLILKQNIEDVHNIYKFTINEFGITLNKVSIPFYEERGVPAKYEEFTPLFKDIREAVLRINRVTLERKRPTCLQYIPPCLFTSEELKSMRYLSFFNVFYYYIFPKTERYKISEEITRSYRTQVYTEHCNECVLKKKNLCGGIVKHHYKHNKDFEYKPIDEETYKIIKPNLEFIRINKEVSQRPDNVDIKK